MKEQFFRHIAQTSDESIALEVERAEGVWLYGPEGRRWLDFISGICVSNAGHAVPEILEAIRAQAARYLHPMVYGEAIMAPQVEYAVELAGLLGPSLDTVYFVNSGAEAVEGALKVAKKFTGRRRLIACRNSYHGSTHGALSVTEPSVLHQGYGPLLPEVSFIRYNELADLEQITDTAAAVIADVVQAAGGVQPADPEWLRQLRRRCDETGTLLIFDEIQTGMGRTGYWFAHQAYGVLPDLITLGKALGGGMPLGAFAARQEIAGVIRRDPVLGYITTFGGHPVSCAAGLALLRKIRTDRLMERVPKLEQLIINHLQHPAITSLRGMGLLYGIGFGSYAFAEAVRAAALERGVLTLGFLNAGIGLRVSPPLTISEEELIWACRTLTGSIDAVLRAG
ncbi:MAG: aspartate aminotransferase family protein [Bacteroidia bacterium]|nr:aspartate aminotransferase family protein [Bacteroidia bacterium]